MPRSTDFSPLSFPNVSFSETWPPESSRWVRMGFKGLVGWGGFKGGQVFCFRFPGKVYSGQITIIPKPELRGFCGDSLARPPFGVTSAEVAIICPVYFITSFSVFFEFLLIFRWKTQETFTVKTSSPLSPHTLMYHSHPGWEHVIKLPPVC